MTNTNRPREYYAPYHLYPEFDKGVEDYRNWRDECPYPRDSIQAQAWDRGREWEMHNSR